MDVMFERVAGMDVGKASVVVCVRTPGPRGGRRVMCSSVFVRFERWDQTTWGSSGLG